MSRRRRDASRRCELRGRQTRGSARHAHRLHQRPPRTHVGTNAARLKPQAASFLPETQQPQLKSDHSFRSFTNTNTATERGRGISDTPHLAALGVGGPRSLASILGRWGLGVVWLVGARDLACLLGLWASTSLGLRSLF